jgi:hypothetical protein
MSPRGGVLEYLRCSPASRTRRRKRNQMPGEHKYRDLVLQVWGLDARLKILQYEENVVPKCKKS